MKTWPSVGFSSPAISRSVVVLPAPVSPEQNEELAIGDLEIETDQRRVVAEFLGNVA